MSILKALILGIIQGATEFLPISSSGHLVLVPWLVGWNDLGQSDLTFDTLVHLGTITAVLAYFWRDLLAILRAVWDGLRRRRLFDTADSRLGWYILAASIPAGLAGVLLEDWFASLFGNPLAVACALLVTALLLVGAERVGKRNRPIAHLGLWNALIIGVGQAVAIIPGISRSGATMAAGLTQGLDGSDAARFSFLLSIPAVVGAAAIQLARLLRGGVYAAQAGPLVVGFLSAAAVGYLAIHSLLLLVRRRSLNVFAAYCAVMGLVSLVVYVVRY